MQHCQALKCDDSIGTTIDICPVNSLPSINFALYTLCPRHYVLCMLACCLHDGTALLISGIANSQSRQQRSVAVDQQPTHETKVVAGQQGHAGHGIFSAMLQELEGLPKMYLVDII